MQQFSAQQRTSNQNTRRNTNNRALTDEPKRSATAKYDSRVFEYRKTSNLRRIFVAYMR